MARYQVDFLRLKTKANVHLPKSLHLAEVKTECFLPFFRTIMAIYTIEFKKLKSFREKICITKSPIYSKFSNFFISGGHKVALLKNITSLCVFVRSLGYILARVYQIGS